MADAGKQGLSVFLNTENLDLKNIPSSMSMDPTFVAKYKKELEWADDAENSPPTATKDPPPNANSPKPKHTDSYEKPLPPVLVKPEPEREASVRSWSAQKASDVSGALIKYAVGPTLLPPQIAEMVSNLSLLARVSLKSAAFFIECILEAAKYGTGMGLGVTRRALIGAVGTARALHSIGTGDGWDAKGAGKSGSVATTIKNAK